MLYNTSVSRPEIKGETKGAQVTPQTETLNISASPATDTGDVKAKVAKEESPYDTFFDSVYLKNDPINTATPSSKTFADDDITIAITSTAIENSIKDIKLNNISLNRVDLTIEDLEVTVDKSCFEELEPGIYNLFIILEKGAAVTVPVTISE